MATNVCERVRVRAPLPFSSPRRGRDRDCGANARVRAPLPFSSPRRGRGRDCGANARVRVLLSSDLYRTARRRENARASYVRDRDRGRVLPRLSSGPYRTALHRASVRDRACTAPHRASACARLFYLPAPLSPS